MDREMFHQIFDCFRHPVLLKSGEDWLTNSAAQALCLAQSDLDELASWGDDASLWLARQFYHVSATRLDGGMLLMLQPDVFLASASENIASQLRLRLNAAFGSTAALSQAPGLRSDLRARDDLSAVNQELYRIFRMVTQLERCGEDAPPPRMGEIDLVELIDRLAGELEELCGKAGVTFTAETDLPYLTMMADDQQLDYLILSLVSNALKNAPDKGGRITLSLKRQQNQALITLSDNAGGFSPDYLSHPLWNDPHRLLPGRGLGLGLPLVQRIAAAHDGTLMVFPSPKGSRVVLSLPIRISNDVFAQPKMPIDPLPGFSLAKILLSDALPHSLYFPNPNGDDE